MKAWLRKVADDLRTSFWAVPTAMTAVAVVLALMLIEVDENYDIAVLGRAARSPEGARALMGTISASMISLAGVTFSITMVALSLASNQFGPRLIRNFMRDVSNQIVLGTFVATFIYGLMVLRSVRGTNEEEFVPHFAVTVGIALALVSVAVLIYFIHHVATSIQASRVVASVGSSFRAAVRDRYPEQLNVGSNASHPMQDRPDERWRPLFATRTGYIQIIDAGSVCDEAARFREVVRMRKRPGHFLSEGMVVAEMTARNGDPVDRMQECVNRAMVTGPVRTDAEDIEYSIRQLVEVAVRALSPGINDPFTAMDCIDWLSSGLSEMSGRDMSGHNLTDGEGTIRVIEDPVSFPGAFSAAFNQIRQNAGEHVSVLIHLADALGFLASQARTLEQVDAVRSQMELTLASAGSSIVGADRTDLFDRADSTFATVERVRAELAR